MADSPGAHGAPLGARVHTRGVVFVHACPRALAAHVWPSTRVLQKRDRIDAWIRRSDADIELRGWMTA